MAGMPWLKLYVDDVLNDATLNSLDDGAKWTLIQLLALAGECDAGGAFTMGGKPMPVEVIAWRLGVEPGKLSKRIGDLVRAGKLTMDGEYPVIGDFMDKQGPTQEAKREEWRKRQAKHRNSKDGEDTDSSKEEEEEEELRVKSKEVEVDLSRVTSHVTGKAAAATPDNWHSLFMDDFLKATGQKANETIAEQAVAKTLDYINGKNYAVKYNFQWIQERYALLSKTQKASKPPSEKYQLPDDYQDDDDIQQDEQPEASERLLRQFEAVSQTWPIAWRVNMEPIAETAELLRVGVRGLSVDIAKAHYGKTLQNTFMKPVAFEAVA